MYNQPLAMDNGFRMDLFLGVNESRIMDACTKFTRINRLEILPSPAHLVECPLRGGAPFGSNRNVRGKARKIFSRRRP